MNQLMYAMNVTMLALASALSLSSCGSETANDSSKPEAQTAISFTNGVTDQNKGMRKGPVQVKVQANLPGLTTLYLYASYGKVYTKIDSAKVAAGVYDFGTDEYEQGVYMLGTGENNLTSIILNPAEQAVELTARASRLEGNLTSVLSKENEAWFKYTPQEMALLKAIKDIRVAGAKSGMKAESEQQAQVKEAELARLQGVLIGEYPNTHFAKLLTWKQEPERTDINKYWDNIDFTDRSLLHGLVLSDRIQNFMRSFSKGQEGGYIQCISTVAEKAKADDTVLEFALNQMLVGFYESGMENISTYIIDNYINGESCGDADLSNIIKSTAESIQRLSIGATPPNIVMTGLNGQSVDLMKMAAAKKYTLVMFWSSWCEHCKGEAPEVKQCYAQWKPKGFEMIGVSVDTNKQLWENAVKERAFEFPNVCGMKQWDSKVAKDYRVTKTPAFFLIDSSGKIVLKPKGIREVQAFLNQNIK
jgi:peroxiredoxin